MAVPTFVGAGTGVVWQSGAAAAVTKTVTIGNFVLIQAIQDGAAGTTTIGTFSGVRDLANNANNASSILSDSAVGSPKAAAQYLLGGIATGTTVSAVVSSPGDDVYARWYEFANVFPSTIGLEATIESIDSAAGTGTTISDVGVTTAGPDRLAVNCVAIDDDNAVAAYTGQTGGTWVEAVAEYLSSTGTDACLQVQTANMPSAGTINGGTQTIVTDNWGVIGFALIAPVAVTPSLIWQPAASSLYGR